MLREISKVRQLPGQSRRRWFTDPHMDLTVWLDEADGIVGFELTYDKPRAERAVTWRERSGVSHQGVDDGEGRPGKYKQTPILVADGALNAWRLCARFRCAGDELPGEILALVCRQLTHYQGNLSIG